MRPMLQEESEESLRSGAAALQLEPQLSTGAAQAALLLEQGRVARGLCGSAAWSCSAALAASESPLMAAADDFAVQLALLLCRLEPG